MASSAVVANVLAHGELLRVAVLLLSFGISLSGAFAWRRGRRLPEPSE
jgi:hypothetical protein